MVKNNINLVSMIRLLLLPLLPHASGQSGNDTPFDGGEIFAFVCGLLALLGVIIYTCAGVCSICYESIYICLIEPRRTPIIEQERNNSVTTGTTTEKGGLDSKVIETLPEFLYTAVKNKEKVLDTCAVCLTKYEDEDMLRLLPCGHTFHTECIGNWLASYGTTCPCCRYNLQAIYCS
ncbi:hypothetical protein MKW94_008530 [Papaver nudicaule]|uniref:RING-type E3 ubiquitin transferase n=1 Tax=Papaver nudicaule TaxID=74823 RepID=A0AA41VD38_PAPNU|nr:hypothetical protein [Papaver nudicaule]